MNAKRQKGEVVNNDTVKRFSRLLRSLLDGDKEVKRTESVVAHSRRETGSADP